MSAYSEAHSAPTPVRRTWRSSRWLLAVPATAFLLVVFAAPFTLFFVYAFLEGGSYTVSAEFTLENFRATLGDPLYRTLVGNALQVGLATAALSILLGLPLAYLIRFRSGRFEYALLFLVVLSMFASYLGRIYAWRAILGDNGVLNQALGAVSLPHHSILFTKSAVILALVHIFLPFVVLVVYAALRNVPRDLLFLAADLGAGPLGRWRSVLLPLLAPAIAASFLYTLVLSASDYVTPQFLGGSGGQLVGVLIQLQFTRNGDFPLGAAMSVILLVLFLAFYAALTGLMRWLRLTNIAVRV